jgi:hypothetical protein
MTVRSSSRTALQSLRSAARTRETGKPSSGTGAHKSTAGKDSPTLLPTRWDGRSTRNFWSGTFLTGIRPVGPLKSLNKSADFQGDLYAKGGH